MGIFYQPILLTGPTGLSESFDGLIDTGALFTVVPASVLRRLGVLPIDRVSVQFANGDISEWELGEITATLEGRSRPILALFGDDDDKILIGAHALEALLLDVDVVEKKLVPKRALLMTAEAFHYLEAASDSLSNELPHA